MEHEKPEYDIQELAAKWVNGTITSKERAYYENWYNTFDDADTKVYSGETSSKQELGAKILGTLQYRIERDMAITPLGRTLSAMQWLSVAASFLLIVAAGTYFWSPIKQLQSAANKSNVIKPGGNLATLHMANGKKIILTHAANGTLVKIGNDSVTKAAGSINYTSLKAVSSISKSYDTLSVPRGGTYQLTLADGSNVWLNSSSALRFPEGFDGKERRVELLYGEAYFEVAHNVQKPFRVLAQSQTVEVLGTHFNLNSYKDEPAIKTTLLEGSVKVSAAMVSKVIKPGEQAILHNGQISLSETNIEEAIAWKNGYFRFNAEKIESIMRKLSRWYNIEVRYEGTPSDEEYTAAISRYRNINEVLRELEYSKSVHFKIEGRRITVMQ